jgi:hypothetical protein
MEPISMTMFEKFELKGETNKVATGLQIEAIKNLLKEMKVGDEAILFTMVDLVMHCVDVGSSAQTKLVGQSPYATGRTREELAGAVKSVCTLRQFGAFFAQIAWNLMIKNLRPPANWSSLGFKESTKFAAFDFFYGVEHASSLKPKEGLVRTPNDAERSANQTSKMVSIFRQSSKEGNAVLNVGEVTGGKYGVAAKIGLRPTSSGTD